MRCFDLDAFFLTADFVRPPELLESFEALLARFLIPLMFFAPSFLRDLALEAEDGDLRLDVLFDESFRLACFLGLEPLEFRELRELAELALELPLELAFDWPDFDRLFLVFRPFELAEDLSFDLPRLGSSTRTSFFARSLRAFTCPVRLTCCRQG